MEQRQQQFQDLRSCVYVTRIVDDSAPLEQVYYTMWVLETNKLSFGGGATGSRIMEHPFTAIARAITFIFPETEIGHWIQYWLAKAVYDLVAQVDVDSLMAQTYAEFENHDSVLLRWVFNS